MHLLKLKPRFVITNSNITSERGVTSGHELFARSAWGAREHFLSFLRKSACPLRKAGTKSTGHTSIYDSGGWNLLLEQKRHCNVANLLSSCVAREKYSQTVTTQLKFEATRSLNTALIFKTYGSHHSSISKRLDCTFYAASLLPQPTFHVKNNAVKYK